MIEVQQVILFGGSGTRLWPLSRAGFPKQFLVLSGSTSLFHQAVERVNGLGASEYVKKIVIQLEKQKREEKDLHRKVSRPWGWFDSIDEGEIFNVKRIMVKPGESLSLQMYHRAEHWIVVKGTTKITDGEKIIMLSENQSKYIPQGQNHRLRNPGVVPLEIIEVQSGSYLGEDDIVRFEDTCGRS